VQDVLLAARVVARYGHGRDADVVTIAVSDRDGPERDLVVKPLPPHEIPTEWVL